MTSSVDITNRALQAIGTRSTISSMAEGSNESNNASLCYAATAGADPRRAVEFRHRHGWPGAAEVSAGDGRDAALSGVRRLVVGLSAARLELRIRLSG
jgi:hypothetical protein